MINTNQNLLFMATILALCVIAFVHIFLFPLYNINSTHGLIRTYLEFEPSLCTYNFKYKKIWKRIRCPRYGIVTVMQGGRLGNQMWEYASVWAISRRTGLEPYVPSCIRDKLDQVFESLSVPTFGEISHCPINVNTFVKSLDSWDFTNQSILLPKYFVQPEIVLTWVQDIVQEFSFKTSLITKSQDILHKATAMLHSRKNTFVGVHIRRTDYIEYLRTRLNAHPANVTFYLNAMEYFKNKFKNVIFIVVSDDQHWCHKHFRDKKDVFLVKTNSPVLDLAILASCNHSIFDYGTYGAWSAILAGGETIYYNLSHHSSTKIGQLLPNWYTL